MKNTKKTPMKNRALIILSTIYIIIEAQAWVFLSSIYRNKLTPETLSDYERFGYASAALGFSLIFIKITLSNQDWNKHAKFIVILAFTPVIYLMSIWGIYESVHQTPEIIPDSIKPKVMRASIYTLENPSWANLGALYNNYNEKELKENVVQLQKSHPVSDRAIQSAYIKGIRAVHDFSDYYKRNAETVDKIFWREVWRLGMYKVSGDNAEELRINNYESKWLHSNLWFELTIDKPSRWIELSSGIHFMDKYDPAMSQQIKSRLKTNPFSDVNISNTPPRKYRDMKISALTWDYLGKDFKNWPSYNFNHPDDLEQFREAYSKVILERYVHLPELKFPWYQDGVDPLESREYEKSLKQIVPFLFRDGKPVLTISKMYDDDIYRKYISNLKQGLPSILRDNWFRYQTEEFVKISTEPSKWKEPTTAALHKEWLRIGILAPLMLVISSLLLIFNIVALFKVDKWLASLTVVIFGIFYSGVFPEFSEKMLYIILEISVKKAMIYLV